MHTCIFPTQVSSPWIRFGLLWAFAWALAAGGFAQCAWAEDGDQPPLETEIAPDRLFNTGIAFFDDSQSGGGLYYFQRKRDRYNLAEGTWDDNLDHASFQAALHFDSGLINDFVGLDLGVYASADMYNHAAPDHEMNFFPWRNAWQSNPAATDARDGASFYKAHLKFRHEVFWANAGYFQPTGPGVLGVNWSFLPGTYQGVETGLRFDKLEVAAAVVNSYKAPWFREFDTMRRDDGTTKVDYLMSLGARYQVMPWLSMEIAYGQSQNYLQNWHMKAESSFSFGPGSLGVLYHLYGMGDSDNSGGVNDNFDGIALQHFLSFGYSLEYWKFRNEYLYTHAPVSNAHQKGYFAYRLLSPNGSSKGAYAPWWDARSDWNHDREMAAFIQVSRSFGDVTLGGLNLAGLELAAGFAIGWNGRAYGYTERLKEHAWTANMAYVVQQGRLQGTSLNLHYTRYYNRTHLNSWEGFKNAFQDERDIKIALSIPF